MALNSLVLVKAPNHYNKTALYEYRVYENGKLLAKRRSNKDYSFALVDKLESGKFKIVQCFGSESKYMESRNKLKPYYQYYGLASLELATTEEQHEKEIYFTH